MEVVMIDIAVSHVQKTFFADPVLKDVSLELKQGERLGLLGDNGSGKSTLFRIIMGEEDFQNGEKTVRKGIRMGCLKQSPDIFPLGTDVMGVLRLSLADLDAMKNELDRLTVALSSESTVGHMNHERLLHGLGEVQHAYEVAGGYESEYRMGIITKGMGLDDEFLKKEYQSLSGGEKTRVMLAKLLIENPDVMLLDEPTNHLDMAMTEWLEEYLKTYDGSCLIISHDRWFLDRVIDGIYELKNGSIESYQGNYSDYLIERERRYEERLKRFNNQEKEAARLETAAKRMRDWAQRGDNEKMFIRARAMERRIERMERIDRPVKDSHEIRLDFQSDVKSGRMAFHVEGLKLQVADRCLIENVSFGIASGECVAIVGGNGTGKSTLLRAMLEVAETAEAGQSKDAVIKVNPRMRIGYLPQDIKFINESVSVLNLFKEYHPESELECRRHLARFDFKQEDVFKPVAGLSGGERVRLLLSILVKQQVNCLVMDEPTNHLDIRTREIIEDTMMDFDGTVLFVSHDRYLLQRVAQRIVALDDGVCTEYIGDYLYYKEEKSKRGLVEQKIEANGNEARQKNNAAQLTKKANPIKVRQLESKIEDIEKALVHGRSQLESGEGGYQELMKWQDEVARLEKDLDEAYAEYFAYMDPV